MERILSEQDRIRRAEEISNRRREKISARSINVNKEKRKMPLLTKVFIQTIASMCIFGMAYFLVQHKNPMMENVKGVLNYDINFEQLYNNGNNFMNSFMQYIKKENVTVDENLTEEKEQNTVTEENNEQNDNILTEENNNETEQGDSGGVGGADENIVLSQDEQDIAFIKANVSLIVPLQGTVTSGYGKREATDIISENHAGVDIGANEGTEIIAAMEGTVEVVSSYGDYGNHVKITNGEVSTLYAHCSNIFVNEGDYITQGQKIAEVGNTGRTTGPHLHFEIIRGDRTIDPQAVLEI